MEKVILFGASKLGEIAFNVLKNRYNICFFCDNDKNKWNKNFCGKKIISPNELKEHINYKIIIASMYYVSISEQLKNLGLENLYVFDYCDANDKTYKKRYCVCKISNSSIFEYLSIDDKMQKKVLDDFNILYGKVNEKRIEQIKNEFYKNILVIAYIFPPIGGAGVQRTLKYTKYLNKLGFKVTVITVGKDFIEEEKDSTLLKEISGNIKIIRIDHSKVNSEQLTKEEVEQIINLIYGLVNNKNLIYEFADVIKKDRSKVAIPDDKIFWVNDVLKNIDKLIDLQNFKYIYTTSSPYSTHIIGYYIKNKYKNVKWIADFRDEWSNNPYIADKQSLKYRLEYEMERQIVNTASKVIHVTPISTENCRKNFNLDKKKVITITNGYDEKDFTNIDYDNIVRNKEEFIIMFSGTVYKNRIPRNLFIALSELIEENKVDKNKIKVKLYGKLLEDTQQIIEKADKYNLVNINGYLPHRKCILENSKSDVLLLPIGEGEKFRAVYSGKVFEYIRLQIPILALAPINGVVAELLDKTKTGETFEYIDLNGIKNFILKHYIMWENNEKYDGFDSDEIKKYERKELTRKLIEVIEN